MEHALLQHLRFAPLSRVELARRTGVSDQRVQAALDELIRRGYVVRSPQDGAPEEYDLVGAAVPSDAPFHLLGKLLVLIAVAGGFAWKVLAGLFRK
ncbi:MAG: MarR family transcriptional regulator [Kribbellaceae bacterium]|nr:MarR family transcriptional regulator [Kribbellaceae bacterium]